jgi:AraC-like DNA-binding protein
MRLHFHEPLSITDIARTMNISDRYLYNLFVKEEGLSPKQHLNGLRVARAVKMLKWTDATISEIAVSVGVPDVLTFSRFFKNIVGVSPSAFRADSRRADKPNDDGEA